MAVLMTINGTPSQGALVRDALCANYGYQAQVQDGEGAMVDNPETATKFAKRQINTFLKNNVKAYRSNQFEAGRASVVDDATAEVDGVETL